MSAGHTAGSVAGVRVRLVRRRYAREDAGVGRGDHVRGGWRGERRGGLPGAGGRLDGRHRGDGPCRRRVIIDDVFLGGAASQQRWQRALSGLAVLWVGVRCESAVAAGREVARGDRIQGMAASQANVVHEGVSYDLEVDTTHTESLVCANHRRTRQLIARSAPGCPAGSRSPAHSRHLYPGVTVGGVAGRAS
jgi:hypothetical protein